MATRAVRAMPWLPTHAMLGGHLALGASWLLLASLGARGEMAVGLAPLAWVHLVALGSLTLIALGILFHVIPGFLDVPVKAERAARGMLWIYMAGTLLLVLGFWMERPTWIGWGGATLSVGLAGVVAPMLLTLAEVVRRRQAPGTRAADLAGPKRKEGAPAPFLTAFGAVFVALATVLLTGLAMAGALAGWWSAAALALAAAHAHLAAGGWLTLLVMGVSVRTLVRITRSKRSAPQLHITASVGLIVGLTLLVSGLLGAGLVITWLGAILSGASCLAYVADAGGMLWRSRDPHCAPRAFMGASLIYLLGAIGLGLGVLAGRAELTAAYVYVALQGWLGQIMLGHLHHIGVRFLATQVLGEDDETEPVALLSPGVSMASFWTAQAAVLVGAVGLGLARGKVVEIGALLGFASWVLINANIFFSLRSAKSLLAAAG